MLPNRKSIRLAGYDYSQSGIYFITICSYGKLPIFGSIRNNIMRLNRLGKIVQEELSKTAVIRSNINIDEFIIMPNHLHSIISITDSTGTARHAHTNEKFGRPVQGSIPTIIRSFKSAVTKSAHELGLFIKSQIWHRNYYEHVIRNEEALERIRNYIITNPENWSRDTDNPDHSGKNLFKVWLDQYNIFKSIDNPNY